MKLLKFILSVIVSTLCVLIPCIGTIYCVSTPGEINLKMLLIFFIPLLFLPLMSKLTNRLRYEYKANEMGMMNDFEYTNLTKEERREFDKQRQMEMERLMPQSAINKMIHKGPKYPQKELDKLTGLAPVKQQIKEITARAEYDMDNDKKALFAKHFVFYGAPGTGKTTVARIMTGLLYDAGCIKQNKCIECDGNTLKGSAPGEGAQKAEILVRNAFGGILFIDEAYAMMDRMGNEAVNTLIKLMEDHRGEFVLILAGYTDEIKTLLNQNPGFRSRINDYVKFPNYTEEEAKEILSGMAKGKDLTIDKAAMQRFADKYAAAMSDKNFGNARTVRNILDRAITVHALNLSEHKLEEKYKKTLCLSDFE